MNQIGHQEGKKAGKLRAAKYRRILGRDSWAFPSTKEIH
jgi:hypothetical protein